MLLGGIGQGKFFFNIIFYITRIIIGKTSVHNILVRYLQGKGAVLGLRPGSSGKSDT